ncbi:MAG: penicillin-binding protein 1C [Verrucomicrobiota bacterium]
MPWPEALSRPVPAGTRITDIHGTPLRRLLAGGMRAEAPPALAEIPQALIQATLAAEDHRFYSHGGIDPAALARAARDRFEAGRRVSGASTVTQQLVKLAAPRARTPRTKVIEALTARRVEMTWPKTRILEQYLQRLDYGNLHLGPAAAAAGYFGKSLADCSLAECAFLAGLPQSPTRLNPWRHADRAVARQQWILGRLGILGWVDTETLARARAEPLQLRRHYGSFAAPHFVDLLLNSLPESAKRPETLTTTLDLRIQQVVERAVSGRLARLAGKNVGQGAVVVLENDTGHVLALTGSRDYAAADGGQVNGATARRSPGSALKPFTYLLALQQDLSPASILPDLPIEYMTASGLYRPQNYNHRASGPVSLRTALANSLNLSAVRTLQSHGGPEALITALQSAGLTTLTKPAAEYGLGLTIGGGEVTLLELTAAYSTLARMGESLPLRFQPSPDPPARQRLFDPEACWLLADILSDNDARARSFGMDSALRLPFPCAVKTGTSTDYRDNWTIGYNARFTVGVWVGNFDNSPMRGVSGVTGAAPVFRDIFSWLESQFPGGWFPQPPGIVERSVDPLTGLPLPPELDGKRPVVMEKFRRELAPVPEAADAARYDSAARIILPAEYAAWLAGPDNWLGNAAVAGGTVTAGSAEDWRISSPLPGTTVLLDPDIPGGGRALPLRVIPAVSGLEWSSPTLEIKAGTALLTPGRHEITARDPASGRKASTWVTVRKR